MKHVYRIVAAFLAFCMLNSCSILQKTSSNGNQNGLATGLALLNLYNSIKQANNGSATAAQTGKLDLSNAGNLLNLAQVLTGAGTLQNATPTYTSQFGTGLIDGSANLVNQNNVTNVLSSLLSLNGINTGAITNAAQTTQQINATGDPIMNTKSGGDPIMNNASGVAETLGVLGNIFSLFGGK